MSVFIHNEEQYLSIAVVLKNLGKDLGCFFGYPEGWDRLAGLNPYVERLMRDFARVNVDAFNERYDEKEPYLELDFSKRCVCNWTELETIKALKSVHYNSIESENEAMLQRLEGLIYHLMSRVINKMPGYQEAETW